MDNVRVIEWQQYGQTVINPISIFSLCIAIVLVLLLKRQYVLLPFIMLGTLIPSIQRVVVAGLDLTLMRILVFAGFIRVIMRGEWFAKRNKIDVALVLYAIAATTAYTLLWKTGDAFLNRIGYVIDSLGVYLIVRCVVRTPDDVKIAIKATVVMSVIVAVAMFFELVVRRNFFSIFGGVPEIPPLREGRYRAQGAFAHPIMAGTFGALLIPLVWSLDKGKNRIIRIVGFASGTIITVTSASSGPLLTYVACVFGIMAWPFRDYRREMAWGAACTLVALQVYMDNPVWYLVSMIDLVGGSTGYHRYQLIDKAVERFSEWALFGTKSTAYWGWGLQDITNQYVLEGVNGGIVSLVLFTAALAYGFGAVGRSVAKRDGALAQPQAKNAKIFWALGVILFANAVSFIGVSFFGHMVFYFFAYLGMIGSIGLPAASSSASSRIGIPEPGKLS